MSDTSQAIELSFAFTFRDRLWSNLLLASQRWTSIAAMAFFPLLGAAVAVASIGNGRPLNANRWVIVAACMLAVPVMLIGNVASVHFGNSHAREPFTYRFDATGIHVRAASYDYTHRWSTISHIKRCGGFLMFFFSPGCAHCVPLRAIRAASAMQPLVAMAKSHGAKVSDDSLVAT